MTPDLARPRLRALDEWIAYGLGTGLAPKAPGTVGSLAAAILHWWWFAKWPWWWQCALVALCLGLGIWACQRVERRLGRHDVGAIVWDEFVGMWLTLVASDASILATAIGFGFFRCFDIAKPWPIGWLDRRVGGGFGVMLDDIVAGLFAAAALWLVLGALA